ncbi:hypothetical protein ACTXG6_34345 [Pseudonocardia sp. Cha107L01]|uniref:hypothetical protein n=1 Tax=Pseudonocardia sp. Cha107L01 TaxID=3457576 RepID=UPI00403E5696
MDKHHPADTPERDWPTLHPNDDPDAMRPDLAPDDERGDKNEHEHEHETNDSSAD